MTNSKKIVLCRPPIQIRTKCYKVVTCQVSVLKSKNTLLNNLQVTEEIRDTQIQPIDFWERCKIKSMEKRQAFQQMILAKLDIHTLKKGSSA